MKRSLSKEDFGFTQIKNIVLTNPNISLKAKGLHGFLYSKPNNWDFSILRIAKEMKESHNTISNVLKELEEVGLLKRTRLSSGRVEYYTTTEPHTKKATYQKCHSGKVGTVSNTDTLQSNKESVKPSFTQKKKEPDKPFSNQAEIQKLRESPQPHVRLIGWYFFVKKFEFPDKQNLQTELRRWTKDAVFISKYPVEKILKTKSQVESKFPDDWKLSTIRKYIV